MPTLKVLVLLLLAGAVILAGCGENPVGGSLANPNAPLVLSQDDADKTAKNFMEAWDNDDYGAMYALISPRSQAAITPEDFAAAYQDVVTKMGLKDLDVTLHDSTRQGTTVVVPYDVVFHSGPFGDVQDPGRTLRLIETPDGWRVAWSRLDIFAVLAEDTRLELRATIPTRGSIYDRSGNVLASSNAPSVLIYLIQQDIPNLDACITALSSITRREYKDIAAAFQLWSPETRFFAAEIDADVYQVEQERLAQLCNVGSDDVFDRTSRRYYKDLAPHLLGYVSQIRPDQVDEFTQRGYPPDALIGQEGIEEAYESELAGKVGGRLVIVSPTGETLRVIAESPASPGQDVYLTIDRNLQAGVEQAFVDAYNFSQGTWAPTSRGAAAVVMNVKTGEILAMASYPGYLSSLFQPDSPFYDRAAELARLQSDVRTPLLNRATMGKYPAGSIFKIVSEAAGLDSGVMDPEKAITCDGTWEGAQYGDVVPSRTDWKPDGHGTGINARRGLAYSCDPYFWELGVALHSADPALLPTYARRMGLGVATGLDVLPEEIGNIPGPVGNPNWALGDTLNLVIGQGLTQITPLQITRMTAAVANGGTLWKPLLVSKVQPAGGAPTSVAQPQAASSLNFKPEAVKVIQEAMCDVTLLDEDTTGRPGVEGTARYIFELWYEYQNNRVLVCGKTGTAQTGGETTKPQAWFTAYAPMNDPEIAITVIVENSCEGSEVAAPIVRRIIEVYYGLKQSEQPPLWKEGCHELGE